MARGGKVRERDLGWNHIRAQVAILAKKPQAVIGVRGKEAAEKKTFTSSDGGKAQSISSSLTLVDVATFHEYGAPGANIPERSFIRATVDANLSTYRSLLEELKNKIFDPKGSITVRQALLIVGAKVKLDIQARIRAGIPPPWAKSTREARIARGGGQIIGETTLIDTGQLVGGITHDVEYKGGGKV